MRATWVIACDPPWAAQHTFGIPTYELKLYDIAYYTKQIRLLIFVVFQWFYIIE